MSESVVPVLRSTAPLPLPVPGSANAGLYRARTETSRQWNAQGGARVPDELQLVWDRLDPLRRVVHDGDCIYHAGERLVNLYVLRSGLAKLVDVAADGREQLVSLQLRGDWLGFDGIAERRFGCDAIAMDTGEIWAIDYERLLRASTLEPALMTLVHRAMSRQITTYREALMSVCTLPADARVARFLGSLAASMAERGMRTDHILLRMTRAEIGNHLGMTLESVSRALSRLARERIIEFPGKGRRDVCIPNVAALAAFVRASVASAVSSR